MNTWLYIITTPLNRAANQYKVGIHTGSQAKLYSRYRTALPEIEIILFVPHDNPRIVENEIKAQLNYCAIVHQQSGKPSEWFAIDLNKLLLVCFTSLDI